jgi:hypothetical protein
MNTSLPHRLTTVISRGGGDSSTGTIRMAAAGGRFDRQRGRRVFGACPLTMSTRMLVWPLIDQPPAA